MTRPLLLVNIGQLLTVRAGSAKRGPRRGRAMSELGLIRDGAVLCIEGKIVAAGKSHEVSRHPLIKANKKQIRELDCKKKVVLPGLVDSHTHPAFVGPRLLDFEQRIAGATYEEIAAAGGGIRCSAEAVQSAGKTLLAEKILGALQEMAAQGTTTVEAKSGYGLSVAAELKSLEAIHEAARRWRGTVAATLLGAHVTPREFRRNPQEYVRVVCEQMIPQAARRKLASFVDVFCDRGAFSLEDCERIFAAAEANGLGRRAHVCQLSRSKLQTLLRFKPASLDHLDWISREDMVRLAASNTVATLLPGANYFLGLERYPPARALVEAGAAVALATDYNPGSSPTTSMAFVMSLACTQMRMSPAEAIVASTIQGAWALGLQERKGSIEAGKDADLAIFDADDYREIPYWVGVNRCAGVVMGGVRD